MSSPVHGTTDAASQLHNVVEVSMRRILVNVLPVAAIALASALVAGCGHKRQAQAPTEVTGARVPTANVIPKAEADQLQRERDELRTEVSKYDREVKRLQAEMQTTEEHEELTTRGWIAVDGAEAELRLLKDGVAQAPAKQRRKLEKSIAEISENVTTLKRDLRQIPSERGARWPGHRTKVEGAMDDLRRSLESAGK
jgi:predicted RNase H-like nuclease (RuvC/YqgF family)